MSEPLDHAAPVGVFDSGVGGLSVLRALRARLPGQAFIYVADSGHAPYGDRPPEFVVDRAMRVAGFLARQRAKALVIACNTASVLVAAQLRDLHSMPIVAMEPAIKPAALATRSGVVLVLATSSTIGSPSVARLCRAHGKGVCILLQACPGLAEQVERGELRSEQTRRLLQEVIRPGIAQGADTIVLGCTHYAFLAAEIAMIAGPSVSLLEPSEAVARQLARVLACPAPVAGLAGAATRVYTSGSTQRMTSFLASIGEPVEQVLALPAWES